ncbi:MAG: prolyl oligopeptidase family serine peptidase [Sorangiineae bacterium]|nr:prolyl oligopeptidase family serine peptidase [Polyangiaceae bacterium]MEB2324641.1 prolyl oligopeptidase family serine peptidase [Sorangiineae bacterium]
MVRSRSAMLVGLALVACGPDRGATPATHPTGTRAAPPPAQATPAAAAPARPDYGYPATRRDDVRETLHGVTVSDPYRWLEDEKSPEVRAWMAAEDAFARERLARLPGRDGFRTRLAELFYAEAMGTPRRFGSRFFFMRRPPKSEKWIVYVREGKTGRERVLLDPNTWSTDGSRSLGSWSVSWDGKKVAYGVRANNSDEATLHVRDVGTGAESTIDVIEGAKYAYPRWSAKSDAFYYTWVPPVGAVSVADRPGYAELRRHRLGEAPQQDVTVREPTRDASTFLYPALDKSGRWLFAYVEHGWSGTDIFFQDLREPPAKRAWKRLTDAKDGSFSVIAHRDRFILFTNAGAPTFRVLRVEPSHPAREDWKELVPARPDATLESVTLVGGKLSLKYLVDVVSRLELRDLDGKLIREVALPGLGTASSLVGDPDDDLAYFAYESFTEPPIIFETSVKTGAQSVFYETKLPITPARFVAEQVKFRSKDGTSVPMFVIHAKEAKRDGANPTILYGYGGFQVAETPSFSSSIYPWLEQGGVYVIANLRGGSEYGEEWHRAGMRRKKQNVFDDFIAAAESLTRLGWTAPAHLAARGASNGGLLVGAAVTQRPDLFGAALCGVPLLDMLRYHRFGSGKTWTEEYGSADDAEDFRALYAYSPYHHVVRGTNYPPLLMLSADSDDRVDPMHARKFVAALQDASTGGEVLLRIEKHAGHGGADLVKASVEKLADEYAFAWAKLGPKR